MDYVPRQVNDLYSKSYSVLLLEDIELAIQGALETFNQVFKIVDALDEIVSEEERILLINAVKSLRDTGSSTKTLFTSRPTLTVLHHEML